ncbi:membrane protein [Streptomyces purpureus]|uniref:Membrane protein n=1 Tax=Streptomyces purpureus TaxID=1951 RepID=A0A918H0T7_9ACTN|nr:membrane protein [Streptomyces purpureus]
MGVCDNPRAPELTDCPQDSPGLIGHDHGGSAVSDARTPAQIEADIVRRREQLAVTLDEIGVRMHPKTIIGDAKARVASRVDQTAGRAYVAVNQAVSGVRDRFVGDDGAPRLERVVPVALLVVGVVGLLALSSRKRKA